MSTLKVITGINWVLISVYGAFVLWAILQKANPNNDAGGGEQEMAIKGVSAFLLIVLVGLNWLSYPWTKIMALLLVTLFLIIIRYIAAN